MCVQGVLCDPDNLVERMSNVFHSNFHLLNLDIIEYVITDSLMFMLI